MEIPGILRVLEPVAGAERPLVIDSPHSGRIYPVDFTHTCSREALEIYEDRFLDLMATDCLTLGATVILADFPRSYIDPNRARDDIDQSVMGDLWTGPFPLRPSARSRAGTGLIWSRCGDGGIYKTAVGSEKVMNRIARYYQPYHHALKTRLSALREKFGQTFHLNLHSMPPQATNGELDIVIGDALGRSSGATFRNLIVDAFRAEGLRVGLNDPYKGAYILETYGRPGKVDSLQIEISKALYLKDDLRTIDQARFEKMKTVLENVVCRAA